MVTPPPPPWADLAGFRAAHRAANPVPSADQVPRELVERKQWLVWRYERGETPEKKPRKMPYYARDGGRRAGEQGSDKDRARLGTFADVAREIAEAAEGDYDGVGFAFLPGDGLVGIDLDGMIDPETGEVSARCAAIVEACASYTELSPSGKGVHIICRGEAETTKSNAIGVEVFAGRQYFTFTGRRWPGSPAEVEDLDAAVVRRLASTVRAARAPAAAPRGAVPVDEAPPAREVFGGRERSLAETVALVEEALQFLASDDYEQWIAIGMACKAGLGMAGYYVWDEWSARSEKYAGAEDTRRRYQGFQPSKISLGSVFGLARDAGWVAPWDRARARTRSRRVGPAPATGDAEASAAGSAPVASDSSLAAGAAATGKKPRARAKAPAGGGGGGGGYGDDGGDTGDGDGDGDGEGHGWARGLVRKNGAVMPCLANADLVLSRAPIWRGIIAYDEFAERTVFRRRLPIDCGEAESGEWSDHLDVMLAIWMQRAFRVEFSPTCCGQAVEAVARRHRFHPVRDALAALPKWDGVRRAPEWLSDYLGVLRTEYSALVGTYFLRGMIKRVMEPGSKFDYCLVLEGVQGVGKSSVSRILGWHWYADTDLDLSNKDSLLALPGHWVYEIPELGGLMKAEERKQKSFLSRQDDDFRPPYGKRLIRVPRQNVFIGTTNEDEYLKDPTGGRRFWPVRCDGPFNLDGLLAQREQLFAEALADYHARERCWPDKPEQDGLFTPEQAKRGMQEPLEDLLATWVEIQVAPFSMADAAVDGLKLSADKLTPALVTRLGIALRKIGCTRREDRLASDSSRRRLYVSPALGSFLGAVGQQRGRDEPF